MSTHMFTLAGRWDLAFHFQITREDTNKECAQRTNNLEKNHESSRIHVHQDTMAELLGSLILNFPISALAVPDPLQRHSTSRKSNTSPGHWSECCWGVVSES